MIRAAVPADLDAVAAIERDSFGAGAWSRTLIEQELAAANRQVLLAGDESGVLGYGSILVVGDVADLQRIAVAARSRRARHGQRLLQALLSAAADRGAQRMLLEVAAANSAAIALYESFAFTPIARRRDYYGPGADAVVMERALSDRPEPEKLAVDESPPTP